MAKRPTYQNIFQGLSVTKILIILCKGTRENGILKKCQFLHGGNWGDPELVEHEKFHSKNSEPYSYWLGFDTSYNFGTYSGRDGKRK